MSKHEEFVDYTSKELLDAGRTVRERGQWERSELLNLIEELTERYESSLSLNKALADSLNRF